MHKRLSLKTIICGIVYEKEAVIRCESKAQFSEKYGREVLDLVEAIIKASKAEVQELIKKFKEKKIEDEEQILRYAMQIKARRPQFFVIEEIVEMYRSGDPFWEKWSKECLVISFDKFVSDIIHKKYPTIPNSAHEELKNCGYVGLIKALPGYEVSCGKFTTYSSAFIRHEISTQVNTHKETTAHYVKMNKQINEAIQYLEARKMKVTIRKIEILTGLSSDKIQKDLDTNERKKIVYTDSDSSYEEPVSMNDSPEKYMMQKEQMEVLKKCIKNLPDRQREAVGYKFLANFTNVQIAEKMNISVGQAKTYVQKGLITLKLCTELSDIYRGYIRQSEKELHRIKLQNTPTREFIQEQLHEMELKEVSG